MSAVMHSPIVWFDGVGAADVALAGGKGANLGELVRAGIDVPPGFVVTTDAYREVTAARLGGQIVAAAASEPEEASGRIGALFADLTLPGELRAAILDAYAQLVERSGTLRVAVRSSATAEDLGDASFAGLQDTYLGIAGPNAVLDAVRRCWASLWTPRALAYRARLGIDPGEVALAVVVQAMVDAESSGVAFTCDPGSGRADRLAIDATWGLGESLVSGRVTPDHLVLDKESGRVVERTTASKEVVTVLDADRSIEHALTGPLVTAQVLSDADAAALARHVAAIERHYGRPMDVEWVRTAAGFQIVQARPITALPEPIGDAPREWPVPRPHTWYFRASIIEQLPDPLTPLFADLVGPAVVETVGAMMERFVGEGSVRPGDASVAVVNGYAYIGYAIAALGRITVRALPAMAKLNRREEFSAQWLWRDHHAVYVAEVDAAERRDPGELAASELLGEARALLTAGCRYYTSVQTVIPQAATAELTFTKTYAALAQHRLGIQPTAFLLGLDSTPILADKALWRLAGWVRERPALASVLADETTDALGAAPAGVDPVAWDAWRERLRRHLDAYGHALYNLDFATPVPADDPTPVLAMLRFYLDPDAPSPIDRSRRLAAERERALAALDRLPRPMAFLLRRQLRACALYGPMREDALADVGLAWPRLRRDLRELGRRLVVAGMLADRDDVFWITDAEATALAAGLDAAADAVVRRPAAGEEAAETAADLAARIAERRQAWRGQRLVRPPQLLPQTGVVRLWERWMPAREQQGGDVLTGIGGSGGLVTGPARLIRDVGDFASMRAGEILVATITTPAYTPLFALASGVVTDVGGPLSHSSIVAREYGIPAVLGTGSATSRIADGDEITVDGTAGQVRLPG